jgi:serine/threonine protein kinase
MHTFTGIDVLIDLRKNVPYAESLAKMIYLDHPDLPGALNRMLCDFLSSMLQTDPRERVSPSDLLKHRWWAEDWNGNLPCKCLSVSVEKEGMPYIY